MMDKALTKLDRFLRERIIGNHPDINYGGCCVFAAALAPYLAKVGKVRIRVESDSYDGPPTSITKARKNISDNHVYEWNEEGVNFWHVAIEFVYKDKTYHVDARGVHHHRRFNFVDGALTLKEAAELASTGEGWNSDFNRREIPTIKTRLERYFRKHLVKSARTGQYRLTATPI